MSRGRRWATTGEAAQVAEVSLTTLQRWASKGLITEAWRRTPGGHLRWDLNKLRELLGITGSEQHQPSDADTPARQPIAAAIVTSNRGVLAEQRHDGRPLWSFPAGEIEPGESPADAAVRETKEETGLSIVVSHVIGERMHPATGRHMFYLAARPYQGTAVHVGDENELADVRWLTLAELDTLMPSVYGPVRDHLTTVLGRRRQTA